MEKSQNIQKYDIWLAELPEDAGSHVQSGKRPVVVVSNNTANRHAPIVSAVPLSLSQRHMNMPTHTILRSKGLRAPSTALCEQLTTLSKERLVEYMGTVEQLHERLALRHCMKVQLGLFD